MFGDVAEGRKLETFYKLSQKPAILIVDPLTGQVVKSFRFKVTPDDFLQDLVEYLDYKGSLSPPPASRPEPEMIAGMSTRKASERIKKKDV